MNEATTTLVAERRRAPEGRARTLLDAPLRALSLKPPVVVEAGATLGECLAVIRQGGTGDSVMVRAGSGQLLGVLTERDVFAHLADRSADVSASVETLMNVAPHTFGPDEPIRAALRLMADGRYRNVPLVDRDGALVGVVRAQDILAYLGEAYPEAILNQPPRPHQRPEVAEGA